MKLKQWLAANGIKHKHFARTLGVHPSSLSSFSSGKLAPSLELALRISALTRGKVSVETLLNPIMPFPVEARLRDCDPVLTDRQLAELERRQYALLGYCAEDHEPPPDPPDDDRQLDLVEYARRAAG